MCYQREVLLLLGWRLRLLLILGVAIGREELEGFVTQDIWVKGTIGDLAAALLVHLFEFVERLLRDAAFGFVCLGLGIASSLLAHLLEARPTEINLRCTAGVVHIHSNPHHDARNGDHAADHHQKTVLAHTAQLVLEVEFIGLAGLAAGHLAPPSW